MLKTIQTASIIWWDGNFWKFIQQHLKKVVKNIHTIWRSTDEERVESYLNDSDLVIFSVSIRNTVDAIKSMSDKIIGDKLVVDLSGIKSKPEEALSELNASEVLSLHPMFGPSIKSLEWQELIEIQWGSSRKWKKWSEVTWVLQKCWIKIIQMTQKEHDSQMGVVQNLMHAQSIILGSTLKKLNKEIKTSSPIFRAHMNIIERMAKQNVSLYSDMQTENQEYLENVYPIWKSESENQFERTEKKDKQWFEEVMSEIQDFVWKKK